MSTDKIIKITTISLLSVILTCNVYTGFTKDAYANTSESVDSILGDETVSIINEYASKYGICPELIEAICFVESGGDNNSTDNNKVGLYMTNYTYTNYDRFDLYDKEKATECICETLIQLMDKCDTTEMAVVLTAYKDEAYNKNIEYVSWEDDDDFTIPEYASKILDLSNLLEKLHGKLDYENFLESKSIE